MKSRDLVITITLFFAMFSGGQQVSYGQSASIEDVWIERNISYAGDYYLAIHSHIVFHNLLNNECIIRAFLYDEDFNEVKSNGYNGDYETVSGCVTTQKRIKPDYIDCEARDFVMYLPNKEIRTKSWRQNYYVSVDVFCKGILLDSYNFLTSRNSFSMSSDDYYAYAPKSSSSSSAASSSSNNSSSGSSDTGSNYFVEALVGVAAIAAGIWGISKLVDGSSSSSNSSSSSSSSSKSSSNNYSSSSSLVDFSNPANIPSFWIKVRRCDDQCHQNKAKKYCLSDGSATRCAECGHSFEGSWGDRGYWDSYMCKIHMTWIPLGDYCIQCANNGLINLFK